MVIFREIDFKDGNYFSEVMADQMQVNDDCLRAECDARAVVTAPHLAVAKFMSEDSPYWVPANVLIDSTPIGSTSSGSVSDVLLTGFSDGQHLFNFTLEINDGVWGGGTDYSMAFIFPFIITPDMNYLSWWLGREIESRYQDTEHYFRAFGRGLTVLLHRNELGLS